MKPQIHRFKHSTAYRMHGFSLTVVKGKPSGQVNILTFNMGDDVSSVLTDRENSLHSLKKFKKALDASRKSVKVIAP